MRLHTWLICSTKYMGYFVPILLCTVSLIAIVAFAFQDIDEVEDKVNVQAEASRWEWRIHGGNAPLHREIEKLVGKTDASEAASTVHLICGGSLRGRMPTGGRRVYLLDIEDLAKEETRAELRFAISSGCTVLHAGLHRRRGYRSGAESVPSMLMSILRRDDLDALAIRIVGMAIAESSAPGQIGGSMFGFVHKTTPEWLVRWILGRGLPNVQAGASIEGERAV